LFAHCFTCTKQSRAAVSVTRALARQGIACLRFDFTGLGGSEGDFGRAGFATDMADLVAAADILRTRFAGPLLLIGHSLGGAAVLASAAIIGKDKIAAIATIGAPSDVPHVLHNIKGDLEAIRRDGTGEVTIGGKAFTLSRDFLDAVADVDLLAQVGKLRLPYLCLHSPTDTIVGVEHAGALFQAAFHPKSFVSLAGADHLLTRNEDAEFAANMIAVWAARYLPLRSDWPMPEEGVIVQTGHGKFGTEVHTPSHRFVADEPRTYGGNESGPTPYDLLLAALGTCTAMTMKMYANQKGWPFAGARVHLRHERNHAEDCALAIDDGNKVQAVYRVIELLGDLLTNDQRAKLIAIADKCPVHRTLEDHLHIHTSTSA
jgi:putative redox protein